MDLFYEKKLSHFYCACIKRNTVAMERILDDIKDNINYTVKSSTSEVECQGYTALHFAVDYMECKIINSLLDRGADPTIKNWKGQTPITTAALCFRNGTRLKKHIDPEVLHMFIRLLSFHKNNHVNMKNDKGISHLHIACWCKNISIVESFLKHDVDVNDAVSFESKIMPGWTPLRVAVEYNDIEMMKLLLDHNADINIKDSKGMSPLYAALEKKDDVLIDLLLESPNVKDGYFIDETIGLTHLHFACIRNNKEKVDLYSDKNPLINSQISFESPRRAGFTPLHFAVIFHDLEVIELLINRGADVTIKNKQKQTPLHICESNEKFKFIVDSVVKKYNMKYGSILNDFLIACKSDETVKIDELINQDMLNDSIDSNSRIWPGYTLLHLAVEFESRNVIKLLMEKGANANLQNKDNLTPIHLAFQRNCQVSILDLLFSNSRDMIENPVNNEGLTHFHVACASKNHEITEKFLNQKEDLINSAITSNVTIDNHIHRTGETALHIIAVKGYKDTAKLLINHGAGILMKNVDGMTPIHLAVYKHYQESPNQLGIDINGGEGELLYHKKEIVETLLETHLDLDANPVDDNGLSHFHISCMTDNMKLVKHFIEKKVDVNAHVGSESKFWAGYTPLHFAVQNSCALKIVKLLIDHGANIEAKEKNGKTPLLVALETYRKKIDEDDDKDDEMDADNDADNDKDEEENENLKVISYLVCSGASTNSKDNENISPLIYCLYNFSDWSFIDILLSQHSNNKSGPIDDSGLAQIHLACLRNNFDLVKECLKQGVNVNTQIDSKCITWPGYTPLHFARDDHKISKLLLESGADCNIQNTRGETPIHMARENLSSRNEILLLMFEHVDKSLNPVDSEGITHLHIACSLQAGTKIVEEYLKNKADIDQPINFFSSIWAGYTPLHVAIENIAIETIELLLKNGADINAENANGFKSIHIPFDHYLIFSDENQKQILSILLKYGADINDRNLIGDAVFDLCLQRGNKFDILKVVPENQWDLNRLHPHSGRVTLHDMVLFHAMRIKYNTDTSLIDIALSWGADINIKDKEGRITIHHYVKNPFYPPFGTFEDYDKFLKYLLEKGADINEKDNNGQTPLHLALSPCTNQMSVKILINNGADINIEDNSGKVAITYFPSPDINFKAFTGHIEKLKVDGSFVHEQNEAYYSRVINSEDVID